MTTIQPASNVAKTTNSSSNAIKTNMDYTSFLRLFMAQMKNQDPTKPNDPTETLSQLASFSNVEQSIKLNDKLDSLLSSTNATLASSLVGKTLSTLDGGTTGVVKSVTSSDGRLTATFGNGQALELSAGYRISGG